MPFGTFKHIIDNKIKAKVIFFVLVWFFNIFFFNSICSVKLVIFIFSRYFEKTLQWSKFYDLLEINIAKLELPAGKDEIFLDIIENNWLFSIILFVLIFFIQLRNDVFHTLDWILCVDTGLLVRSQLHRDWTQIGKADTFLAVIWVEFVINNVGIGIAEHSFHHFLFPLLILKGLHRLL